MILLEILLIVNMLLCVGIIAVQFRHKRHIHQNMSEKIQLAQNSSASALREFLIEKLFKEHLENSSHLQNNLNQSFDQFSKEIRNNVSIWQTNVSQHMDNLTNTLHKQLHSISSSIDNSLSNNLSKSNEAYNNITKRLTLIDAAQKRIGELSTNIISLQDILSNKQARGAFGEVQLTTIVKNIIPPDHYKFQYTLKNSKRADCVIYLPEPTGKLVIDAKFPLESYRLLQVDSSATSGKYDHANKQFKRDIKKHIHDIADKYIIPEQTADCAIMFIPAESVFSEIHANHPELVQESFNKRVWMASPTTMMAILNTSSAVIKDIARQKEINLIQNHLGMLAKDFHRFQNRMESLSKHIRQANNDVENVHSSAKKIISRFDQIEKVEIEPSLTSDNILSNKKIS